MNEHPLQGLMDVALQRIKEMVDSNTIIGNPITMADGTMILPVSKVSFGFASGGSDFVSKNQKPEGPNSFGGGGGAGVNIAPVAFLVVKDGYVRMLPVAAPPNTTVDRVVEMVPEIMDRVTDFIDKKQPAQDKEPQE